MVQTKKNEYISIAEMLYNLLGPGAPFDNMDYVWSQCE